MKKNFWKIAACSAWMTILGMLIFPVLVFADPIVVGVPHEEFVAYCPTLEAAKTFALTEEQSIAAGETTTQYNKKVAHLFDDAGGPCKTAALTYTAKEILYRWVGWGRYNTDNDERKEWSLVQTATDSGDKVFVLSYHPISHYPKK